ncbi:hypothetical protein GOFOIKOB_4883 [Methylobacterium tardum]|nr:hypothetical protein GOFOIKOB_4883 [Methylobacterium tardum]
MLLGHHLANLHTAMMDFINKIPLLASCAAICTGIYGIFAWAESRIKPQFRDKAAEILLRQNKFSHSYDYLSAIYSLLFGTRQISLRCFAVSYLLALTSFAITRLQGGINWSDTEYLLSVIVWILEASSLICFPIIYASLLVDRNSLNSLSIPRLRRIWPATLLANLIIKYALAWFAVRFIYRPFWGDGFLSFLGGFNVFNAIILSYCLIWLALAGCRSLYTLSNVLDIEKQPLQSLGIVLGPTFAAAFLLISISGYFIFIMALGNLVGL